MSVGRINVLGRELDETLDRPGFGHRAASIGDRIGGARIGTAVYEDSDKLSVWPGPAEVVREPVAASLPVVSALTEPATTRLTSEDPGNVRPRGVSESSREALSTPLGSAGRTPTRGWRRRW